MVEHCTFNEAVDTYNRLSERVRITELMESILSKNIHCTLEEQERLISYYKKTYSREEDFNSAEHHLPMLMFRKANVSGTLQERRDSRREMLKAAGAYENAESQKIKLELELVQRKKERRMNEEYERRANATRRNPFIPAQQPPKKPEPEEAKTPTRGPFSLLDPGFETSEVKFMEDLQRSFYKLFD